MVAIVNRIESYWSGEWLYIEKPSGTCHEIRFRYSACGYSYRLVLLQTHAKKKRLLHPPQTQQPQNRICSNYVNYNKTYKFSKL